MGGCVHAYRKGDFKDWQDCEIGKPEYDRSGLHVELEEVSAIARRHHPSFIEKLSFCFCTLQLIDNDIKG